MIVIAELELPDELHFFQITLFGLTSASVIVLMLISLLNSTLMLIAIMRYDSIQRIPSFEEWWEKQCQDDYRVAYQAFTTGVPLFIVLLAQMGWITFSKYDPLSKNFAASVVTIVATVPAGWWFSHCHPKFRKWNMSGPTKDEDTTVRERPAAWAEEKKVSLTKTQRD